MSDSLSFYPSISDKDFEKTIYSKAEFNSTKYKENYYDGMTIDDLCNYSTFTIQNHQLFMRRFMSPETPYKSILLFHGVGTGKTCASITIAEGFKTSLKNKQKKIRIMRGKKLISLSYPGVYVISSKAIQKNFRNEMYNTNKVKNEEWAGMLHCVGSTYYADSDNKVSRNINAFYTFFGPLEFGNFLKDLENYISIDEFFSNSIFIIDEVHNVISEERENENENETTIDALKRVLSVSSNNRLIMMSATPMRDTKDSIVNILSLLRLNDKNDSSIDTTKLFPDDNTINEDYLKELARGYISYLRGNNPVSFPKLLEHSDTYIPNPKYTIKKEEYNYDERMFKLFKCVMKPEFQFDVYVNLKKDNKLNHIPLWEASTIVFPNGKIGDNGFNETFSAESGRYKYKSLYVDFLKLDKIERYSTKFYQFLNLSMLPGLHYVYSLFDKSGALTLALAMEANGYTLYNSKGKYDEKGRYINNKKMLETITRVYRCYACGKLLSNHDEDQADHDFKQGTYMLFTGTEDTGLTNLLQTFNDNTNKNGEVIKFIIGTQVSAEGVDYKRIKHIHILNPWHNYTRIWQAIGRGLRNCSQADFPEQERNVTVYRYSAAVPASYSDPNELLIETIDEESYRRSLRKDIWIKKVERILKEIAIDCALNKNANIYKDDKDNSRDCDYMDCEYKCDFEPTSDIVLDEDTYTIKEDDPEITKITNLIYLLFKKKSYYKLEDILKLLSHHTQKQYIYIALTQMLTVKNTVLKDYNNRLGFLVYKNGYYYYQPNEFDDIDAPLRYKEQPLKMKITEVPVISKPINKINTIKKESNLFLTSDNESSVETRLRSILNQKTIEAMWYQLDKNNQKSICEIVELLLQKSEMLKKFNREEISPKVFLLISLLEHVGFIFKQPGENNNIYWTKNNYSYIGHITQYWKNVGNQVIRILDSNNNWITSNDLNQKKKIIDSLKQKNKILSSTSETGCYIHGIPYYDLKKDNSQFLLYYDFVKDKNIVSNSSDNRKNPRGKNIKSYKTNEYDKFIACLGFEVKQMSNNKKAENIELMLRKYDFENKNNYQWIQQNKK